MSQASPLRRRLGTWILVAHTGVLIGATDAVALSDASDLDLGELLAAPLVESASLREQSLLDAPAAITLITGEQLRAMGATSVPEALRRVVGLHVIQVHANDYAIGMRGYTSSSNDRVLVLVDGTRLDDTLTGTTRWAQMPASLMDVERIEIIRGPNSTLYGLNALHGVINIVTRGGLSPAGFDAMAAGGMNYLPNVSRGPAAERQTLESMGLSSISWTWHAPDSPSGLRLGAGFEDLPEWLPPSDRDIARHGGFRYYATGAASTEGQRWNADLRLAHVGTEGYVGRGPTAPLQLSTIFTETGSANLQHRGLLSDTLTLTALLTGRRQHLTASVFDRSGAETGAETESYWGRAQLLAALESFAGRNILTLGLESTGYRESKPLFGTKPRSLQAALLLQDEFALLADRTLLLNLGARLERVSASDSDETEVIYQHFSPRGTLSYRLSEEQSIRFSVGTAVRTPAGFENFVGLTTAFLSEPAPKHRVIVSNPRLQPEQILSMEVGYRGRPLPELRIDSALYVQRFKNRVEFSLEPRFPVSYENLATTDEVGLEIGGDFILSSEIDGYLHYTFTAARFTDTGETSQNFPPHLMSLGLQWKPGATTRIGGDLTFASGFSPEYLTTVDRSLQQGREELTPQVVVNLRAGKRLLDDGLEAFILAKNIQGFVRGRGALRQYVSPDTVSPVGATIMIGLTVEATP